MVKLITFTDDRMTISANKCVQSAMTHGADGYSLWTMNDLSAEFKETMADVLAIPFGAGLYCWKPEIVSQEMRKLKEGDILVYCDAGNEWVGDMRRAIEGMADDYLFFANGWPNGDWCKMDVINKLVQSDRRDDFIRSPQLQASTFFIRVSSESRYLIWLWLKNAMIVPFIDNSPSDAPNIPTFQETRWDQSILSALVYQRGIPLHWFPTTTAAHLRHLHPDDKYPILLNHHRKRNNEW